LTDQPRRPSLTESLIPLVGLAVLVGLGYGWFSYRIEVMLLSGTILAAISGWLLGFSWKNMEKGIIDALATAMPAIFILIAIGALIASWMTAGIIPMFIVYGLELMSARFFLVTACLVCSIISMVTGTAWGTVGTVGVALMGVAQGLGVPAGAAAGAIVSGAYFGDKMSPFSDTTNLAPIVADSNIVDHIRWMLWTTVPAWSLGLAVYFVVGLISEPPVGSDISELQNTLRNVFNFSPVLLLPPLMMIWFSVKKMPILPGMLASTAVALVIASVLQNRRIEDLFSVVILGDTSTTGKEMLDILLSTEGMNGMMSLVLLILCAFTFAGVMRRCGFLDRILQALLTKVDSTPGLVISTVASGVLTALITGSSYLSMIIPGELFRKAYKSANLAAKNLSRTLEDSGSVVVPLVPWSAAGTFMAGTLGVASVEYLPWAIMNYMGFIFALILGITGIGIAPRIRQDETLPGS
jgi:NhaC family Na+:H+ antiporter